jgi:hypothetical protein
MATRRFNSATTEFGVPLSVPGSRYVEHGYDKHGKGYARAQTLEVHGVCTHCRDVAAPAKTQ